MAYKLSDVIRAAQEALQEHGDLPVVYASNYDWVMELASHEVTEDAGWDNEPAGKFFFFGN